MRDAGFDQLEQFCFLIRIELATSRFELDAASAPAPKQSEVRVAGRNRGFTIWSTVNDNNAGHPAPVLEVGVEFEFLSSLGLLCGLFICWELQFLACAGSHPAPETVGK